MEEKGGERRDEVSTLSPLLSVSFFLLSPHFAHIQNTKNSFLVQKHFKETLALQANF